MELKKGNQLLIAAKKLDGKAHSNPGLLPTAEPVSSVVQLNAASIFVDTIPANSVLPVSFPANYTLFSASLGTKPIVELVEFQLERLAEGNYAASVIAAAGTDVSSSALAIAETSDSGTARDHAYLLKLPTDYSSAASNPKKGTAPYVNNTNFSGSGFGLQLIPPAYGARYTAKVFEGATEIPANDESNWVLDYGAGLLFIQDKAGALTTTDAPTTVRAYLYIGDYAATTIAALSASLQSVAATNAYATMSVGGVAVIADTATGTLTIASGSFGGAATTNNNLLISASAGNDTITFSLVDSPRFTHITASGNISSSGNLSVTGNSTIGGNLSVDGNTTLGNAAADTASINAGRVNISNLPVGSSELTVLVTGSGGQVFTRQLAASAFSGGSGVSGTGTVDRLVLWSGSSGTTSVTNDDAELSFNRGTNVLTIGSSTFGNDTNITNNLIVGGDLTVNGETTIINTTNLSIEDKFIVLGRSSGSQTPIAEGGIIIEGAGGSGSAFLFNSGSGTGVSNRWGIATNVPTGSTNVTPTDFMVTVSSSGAAPSDANPPAYGGFNGGFGNMHIQDNGEIWIYS